MDRHRRTGGGTELQDRSRRSRVSILCAYGIEKKLSALEGVERVETNLREGAVIVTMKDGATLVATTAGQAVKDAGFTLKGFERLSRGGGG